MFSFGSSFITVVISRENSSVMDTKCESEGNSTDKNFRVDPKEFYKTYDVMTGIRIAATLSSFFGLMVIHSIFLDTHKYAHAIFISGNPCIIQIKIKD